MDNTPYNIIENIKAFLYQNRSYAYKYIILLLDAPLAEVILPHFYGKAIDNLGKCTRENAFSCNKGTIITILGLWGTVQLMQLSLDKLDAEFIPKINSYFRDDMVKKVLKYYEQRGDDPIVGDLLSKIIRLPATIVELFHQFRTYVLPTLMISVCTVVYMFHINKKLGALMLFALSSFGLILYNFMKSSVKLIEKQNEEFDKLHEEISDMLSNSSNIHSSSTLQDEIKRLSDSQKSYSKALNESLGSITKFKRIFSAAYFSMFAVISGYSVKLYQQKCISLGEVSTVLIILLSNITNLTDVANGIRDFMFNLGRISHMQEYMDKMLVAKEPILNSGIIENIDFSNFPIIFDKATVATDDGKIVLKKLSLTISPKKLTIIRGGVGSGKSTILKTIMKTRIIVSGNILIGGKSIKDIESTSIKRKISYVPQNPTLFNRSVLDNIVYGTSKTINDVNNLLRTYNIEEFKYIDLNKYAGKNGNSLSGGQKQLILILRALLKSTRILLLDEPTSNLSASSRDKIMMLLNKLNNKTRTIVVVTHDDRLDEIADDIIRI